MGLFGIIGGMRRAKTILAVKAVHDEWQNGRQIKTNLTLRFGKHAGTVRPEKFSLMDLVQFTEPEQEKNWNNISLLWDEIYMNLECRLSAASELNRIASYFIFQSGKRDVSIYWTSQMFGNPDNRLRWATIEVGTLIKAKGMFVQCPVKGRLVNASVACWQKNCPNLSLCKERCNYFAKYRIWNGSRWRSMRINFMQRYFDLYRTEETISYRETEQVQAYLRARRSAMRKKLRQFAEKKLERESSKEFMKELDNLF